ncbi:MAG: hypothetical protein JWM59_521 [Verrucomicrobiales bacterium]|nr:hypothetical protein [Verrucomicrobiales bacterium]
MKPSLIFPALTALLSLAAAMGAETAIEGRVELPKGRPGPVVAKRYEIVSKGGVISTDPPLAVVYLEGPFRKPSPPATRQLTQKNLTFIPALLPVQVGTKVEFPNEDDTYHNIFSFSPAKRFDLGRYRPEERPIPSQIFDKAGPVTLRCDIHEHMRALILVLDTPHFVMTGTDGRFRLAGVPDGRYRLKAWTSSKTTLEKQVEIKSGAASRVDFP